MARKGKKAAHTMLLIDNTATAKTPEAYVYRQLGMLISNTATALKQDRLLVLLMVSRSLVLHSHMNGQHDACEMLAHEEASNRAISDRADKRERDAKAEERALRKAGKLKR